MGHVSSRPPKDENIEHVAGASLASGSEADPREAFAKKVAGSLAWGSEADPREAFAKAILARLMHRSADLVMLFGPDGRLRYANPSCAEALRRPVDALVGRDLPALAAVGLDRVFVDGLAQAFERVVTHRLPQRFIAELDETPAGRAHYEVSVALEAPRGAEPETIVAIGHDISAFRVSQERWRRTAERLGIMASTSGAAFVEFDRDGNVLYANELARRNLCDIAGRELPIVGQNICDIVDKAGAEVFVQRLRHAFDTGAVQVRLDHSNSGGDPRVWETTDTPELDDAGRPIAVAVVSREITSVQRLRADRARLIAALPDALLEHDDGGVCQFAHVPVGQASPFSRPAWAVAGASLADVLGAELAGLVAVARARSGGNVETFGYRVPASSESEGGRELEVRVTPREDGGTVTILRDVTSERRLEALLLLSDRLASLGRVAAGIAHELNNPLTFLSANVELAMEATTSVDPIHPLLLDIREGVDRIRAITDDIRVLARPETQAAPTADVGEVVRSAVRMMGAAVRKQARLVVDVPPLGRVRGPMSRLVQVVTNLVGNAVQAFSETDLTRQVVAIRAALVGDHVELTVEDNGSGIAAEHIERVFEPFFTTKDSEGMGLGLPISQAIVTEIGGTLTLISEVGRGTTARVTLPLATA